MVIGTRSTQIKMGREVSLPDLSDLDHSQHGAATWYVWPCIFATTAIHIHVTDTLVWSCPHAAPYTPYHQVLSIQTEAGCTNRCEGELCGII